MSFLNQLLTNLRLSKGLRNRYKLRPVLEVVKQLEEFRYRYNEAIKKEDKESSELVKSYEYYIKTLEWVTNANYKNK